MELSIDLGLLPDTLNRLQHRITNLRPLLLEIGEDELDATKIRFQTTKDPDGNFWQANSAVTLANKSGNTPLTGNSGKLFSTIKYQLSGADAVVIGSDRKQAAMMQFGGTKSEFPHLWGDIPARPFLGFSDSDIDRIKQLIADYLA